MKLTGWSAAAGKPSEDAVWSCHKYTTKIW